MNSTFPRLKPLALILAATFPIFAHAAPNVSASGYYQYNGYEYDPAQAVNSGDSFNQAATTNAFSQTKSGGISPSTWISSEISAASDGLGHFGSSIQNSFSFPEGLTQKAGTLVSLTDTITNNTGSTQNVNFNFNIDKLYISTLKGMEMGGTMTNTASFVASIDVNGSTAWSTGFHTEQIDNETVQWNTMGADIGLGTLPVDSGCNAGYFYSCSFSIQNYTNTLNLGALAANASLTVTYTVKLDTETNTYGGASSIVFSDPAGIAMGNELPGSPAMASLQFAAPVPEPEQASMLLAGLALIGAAAKRRRKSR